MVTNAEGSRTTPSVVAFMLSILFAALILIVIVNAMIVWYRALTTSEPLPSTEVPAVPSTIVAPSGLIATAAEKRALAASGERS